MTLSEIAKRFAVARTALLLDMPFFGMLSLRLAIVEDATCKTAWTDGRSLGYNPAYVHTLSDDQLKGLIAHEVMHCACGHPWRRDGREPKKWNVACDYAINSVLADAGLILPDGGLRDANFDHKWAEWIFDRLPDDPPSDQGGDDSEPGTGGDDVKDAPTGDDAPTESDWQEDTKQAVQQSRGTMSAGQKADITTATIAHTDWRSLLRKYAQEITNADYTWTRPNVRYMASGLYLPSLRSEQCGVIAIAVDTSGSIDDVLLSQFAAEIRTIADELKLARVDVLYCDAQVHRVDSFERGDDVVIVAVGRGGTSFVPVFEAIAESGESPAVLIYLTDLDGSFPTSAPEYPVIWAAYGTSQIAPFGDTVPCE